MPTLLRERTGSRPRKLPTTIAWVGSLSPRSFVCACNALVCAFGIQPGVKGLHKQHMQALHESRTMRLYHLVPSWSIVKPSPPFRMKSFTASRYSFSPSKGSVSVVEGYWNT